MTSERTRAPLFWSVVTLLSAACGGVDEPVPLLWLSGGDMTARVASLPVRDDIDRMINEQLIVELYSK